MPQETWTPPSQEQIHRERFTLVAAGATLASALLGFISLAALDGSGIDARGLALAATGVTTGVGLLVRLWKLENEAADREKQERYQEQLTQVSPTVPDAPISSVPGVKVFTREVNPFAGIGGQDPHEFELGRDPNDEEYY